MGDLAGSLALIMGLGEGRVVLRGPFSGMNMADFFGASSQGDGQEKKAETEKTQIPPDQAPTGPLPQDHRTDLQAHPDLPPETARKAGKRSRSVPTPGSPFSDDPMNGAAPAKTV